ncbi:hypothetical protein OG552_10455 [Streptomyces sp. NBC_01476]|uniref:hypothetical protein n=1 Tax=Streptomyces sp. NBC_01476 TaxID=2903881 RepID=UPI002E3082C5|nr:hypothetical protein [Streptomyces sp. NBC_01476]
MATKPTALLIPSPWSGDEYDPVPRSYWAWIWLYTVTRKLRHFFGMHDWDPAAPVLLPARRCTWCGAVTD